MKLICLVLLVVAFCSCETASYFIVRHAEKETAAPGTTMSTTGDPNLSPAGRVRAIELREELKGEKISYIFSTNTIRTISTAQPLNNLIRVPIQLYKSSGDSLDYFIQILKGINKANVLVVGHSNTVDDIVNKLCGSIQVPADLKDSEYDNIFIVTKKGKKYDFSIRTYGTPTE